MNNELSLFGISENEETLVDAAVSQTSDQGSEMLQSRTHAIQDLSRKIGAEEQAAPQAKTSEDNREELHEEKRSFYIKEEIFQDVVKYFGGDELAAGVWIDKYALKNRNGQLMERTPEDMHRRMAREFARIERRYVHPMDEKLIFDLFDHFKYIIPQGSPMAGIGNTDQVVSLSNCFVIGNDGGADSYGGIMKLDEEQVQLMKRRGGVGHDLSDIRPSGSHVQNCALTSTGVVPFMERYSNSTREVAQDGRRGALMLTISIKHPDSEKFIDAKMTEGKVTGANVSVKIDDDFMQCVQKNNPYTQQYPIDSKQPQYHQEIDAQKLWKKIIHNAWKSAEPGVLFWDTIRRESVPDCYADEGFTTVSTNPCGEIPLCPYDSCRLIAINLYSYVENPFTDKAYFNMPLFKEHVQYAQRLMDDIIDLELEKIDQILAKIESDPESESVKRVEKELWLKIRRQSTKGRTGLGITAEGDMLAALNIRYGSDEGNAFSTEVHKQLALAAYRSSITMAKERGAFPIYSCIKEGRNPFVQRLRQADPKLYEDMIRYGRRNIALLTIAPTGSVSICTQTTSGLEPAFNVVYKRRRKINPNDMGTKKNVIKDVVGDSFEEYLVFHQKFVTWAETNGYTYEQMSTMSEKELAQLVEKSPYYKSTASDTDYIKKVELQGSVQKWVDHSISVTVNRPSDVSEQVVADLYMKAWQVGCKGMTVYREGSRNGVLESLNKDKKEAEKEQVPTPKNFKRPKELQADVIHFKNNSEDWVAYIGLYNGKPYEIFTGKTGDESFLLPKWVEHGIIIKNRHEDGTKSYDFKYFDKAGYEVRLCGLDRCFDQEFWNYAKMTSALLRNGIPVQQIVNIISSLNFRQDSINSWRNGVSRALKKFIQDGTKQKNQECPNCHETGTMEFKEGCLVCTKCGYSKCGN